MNPLNPVIGQQFVELALARGVIRFGEFILKSGRVSPYFFNLGAISSGAGLEALAHCYADALIASGVEFDMLFGPAYKGIALAAALSMALHAKTGRDVPFAYNRKEAKTHGEGGSLAGAALFGRVLIVDDVITAGTAVREAIDLIRASGAQAHGLIVAFDRQERGAHSDLSALTEIQQTFALQAFAVASFSDLAAHIQPSLDIRNSLESYRARYGEMRA